MAEKNIRKKQINRILTYLSEHDEITQLDALSELGVMRLASRISDMKDMGYGITKRMVKVTNRFGEETEIASYGLIKEVG